MYKERISGYWFKVMSHGNGSFRAQTDSAFHSKIIERRLDWRLSREEANADLDAFAEEYSLRKVE